MSPKGHRGIEFDYKPTTGKEAEAKRAYSRMEHFILVEAPYRVEEEIYYCKYCAYHKPGKKELLIHLGVSHGIRKVKVAPVQG